MRNAAYVTVTLSSLAMVALFALFLYQNGGLRPGPDITTSFQSVQMTNGQVFFGRLDRAGSAFLALREVYLLQSKTNPETKQTTNTLVKRAQDSKEDAIYLNAAHILAIEAVKPDSNIDKLIQEAQRRATAPTP